MDGIVKDVILLIVGSAGTVFIKLVSGYFSQKDKIVKDKQDALEVRVNDGEKKVDEVVNNYITRLNAIKDDISNMKLAVQKDISDTRHGLKNDIHNMNALLLTMVNTMNEKMSDLGDKFISREICEAFHRESKLEIDNLKERIDKKAS